MGWLEKVKQTAQRAAEEVKEAAGRAAEGAGDAAAVARLKVEIHTLNARMEDALEAIGARVYDLHEAGTAFPPEVETLCRQADALAGQIAAKEAEIARVRAET
ncbi:MAG: hypothetical protein QN122_07475 [Armatimonadota bacterium]|nr:hypothetical protein [Armatimonadota bacterium]